MPKCCCSLRFSRFRPSSFVRPFVQKSDDTSSEDEEEERPRRRRRRRWKTPTEAEKQKALAENEAFKAIIRAFLARKDAEEEARRAGRCEQKCRRG